MKPILYNYFRSSASYRARIALYLKGVEFEYRPVNLLKAEQRSSDYLKINPKGEVPYFIDGEIRLSQSLVICEYLDEKKKTPALFPKQSRFKILEICELIGAGIQPLQNLTVLNELTARFSASEDARVEWNLFWMGRGFDALEVLLNETAGKYCVGDEVTAADCFLVPQVFSANRWKMNLSKYPMINKVNENCSILEPFQRAHPAKQIDFVN